MRGFGFTMVVGIIVGTYSTIFIACPIVIWWVSFRQKQRPSTARAGWSAASTGISRDSQTGQVSISTEARSDLQQAGQAWDDYMATKPERVSVSALESMLDVTFALLDAVPRS